MCRRKYDKSVESVDVAHHLWRLHQALMIKLLITERLYILMCKIVDRVYVSVNILRISNMSSPLSNAYFNKPSKSKEEIM
jgi:hypothetical protein